MNASNKILRVLFIEDSEDDFELVCLELVQGGFELDSHRVDNALALRAALKNDEWDVVICDHNLPALDSTTALSIVKETHKDLPFIIVSGLIPDEVAIESMRQGAKDYIRKNSLSRLAPVVERELKESLLRNDLKRVSDSLYRVSHFDHLTGLANREQLFKHLGKMMPNGESQNPFCIFMIDLNRFNKINRSLGIVTGNTVLTEVAKRLLDLFGDQYFVARYWADKFVLVAKHFNYEEQAELVVNKIHDCLDGVFQIGDKELFLTASVGVSFYPKDGQWPEYLMEHVETALFKAKLSGRRSYRAYEMRFDDRGLERLDMESALHKALRQNEFILCYQPQIDLAENKVIGVEALIRWRNPLEGMVSPAEFIPVLEETGLIVKVGEWILRTACAQNKKWQDSGLPPIRMSVNMSAIQFQQPDLIAVVNKTLQDTGLKPEYLELEITENVAVNSENSVIGALDNLRAIGVRLAIDDFGTGYSSLSYLKQFPIDKLKIDQSFIHNYSEGNSDNELTRAIIKMGHGLKLKVIAEGVETQEQADFLRRSGCDEVQGYFFGRPMPEQELTSYLKSNANVCFVMD